VGASAAVITIIANALHHHIIYHCQPWNATYTTKVNDDKNEQ
jgi:hypothetical protein